MHMRSASSSNTPAASFSAAATRKNLAIVTRVPKFLRCLYDILHTEDQSILSWSDDGSYFQIFSTKRLEDAVLPKYFKHSKFASFQRQLNNFGFRKWTKTQSSVCTFSHHLFVQKHPNDLVELIIEQNEQTSSHGETTDEEIASPKKTITNKRKHNHDVDSDNDETQSLSYKMHKTSTSTGGSFQELLNFQVESGDLMPIINPMEWEPRQTTTAAMKVELGNETPTSAAALNEHTFNFTMEELDDILFTTSEPECSSLSNEDERLFGTRFMNEPVETSVSFATVSSSAAPSSFFIVDHSDTTGMYLNDMFSKPDAEFWLPC